MRLKFKTVHAGDIIDAYSGISLLEVSKGIAEHLTAFEMDAYQAALQKVKIHQKLNRKDVRILDKIDETTYKQFGMCLKDSSVTKARLKACKRYGIQFNDRDELVEHMNQMLSIKSGETAIVMADEFDLNAFFGNFLLELLGEDGFQKFATALRKLHSGEDLNNIDVEILSKVQNELAEKFDWAMWGSELQDRIDSASLRFNLGKEQPNKFFH